MSETRTLVKKIAEITAEIGVVQKSGYNSFHKYKYVTEADIVAEVRQKMAKRHLALFPSAGPVHLAGDTAFYTVAFTIVDGESGEREAFAIPCAGQDKGDKGPYKAMTGAMKYALCKLFQIETGDDPELENDAEKTPSPDKKKPATPQKMLLEDAVDAKLKQQTMKIVPSVPRSKEELIGLLAAWKVPGEDPFKKAFPTSEFTSMDPADQEVLRPLYIAALKRAKG